MGPQTDANWLTSKEAAALLRVHPKHVYRLLRRGLPAQRVGGHWRFTAAELHVWAQRGSPSSHPSAEGSNKQHWVTGETPQLIASVDDLVVDGLVAEANRRYPPTVARVAAGTTSVLSWLEGGAVLAVAVLGELAAPAEPRLARLHIAHQEFGLVGPPSAGPPELAALRRSRPPLASWAPGTNLRALFDAVLLREGLDPANLHHHATKAASHFEVVSAVLRGQAAVGVTTGAWARCCGLPFRALGSRPLGLVVRASSLANPTLVRLWEATQTVAFRDRLAREGGCDASEPAVIRYLPVGAPASGTGGWSTPARIDVRGGLDSAPGTAPARVVVLTRPGGVEHEGAMATLVADLQRAGIGVAGFLEVARRSRGGVTGYDLERIGTAHRIVLARRAPRRAGAASAPYRRFDFRPSAFERALGWLQRDAPRAAVLVVDGIRSREAEGGGHLGALDWACRQRERKVVVCCVRADRLPAVQARLGLAAPSVASDALERCTSAAHRAELVSTIVSLLPTTHP